MKVIRKPRTSGSGLSRVPVAPLKTLHRQDYARATAQSPLVFHFLFFRSQFHACLRGTIAVNQSCVVLRIERVQSS